MNTLNQLTNVTRTGTMTVAGTTTSAATNVTVNTSNAVLYSYYTFASTNHSLTDGTNIFTAIGKDSLGRVDTNVATVYLPASPTLSYDSNGNLTYDGLKALEYDDENQLTKITATNLWKSQFTYDGKMRRRIRREYAWQNGAWILTNDVRYVYDGTNTFTAIGKDNLGRVDTNVATAYLPASPTLLLRPPPVIWPHERGDSSVHRAQKLRTPACDTELSSTRLLIPH